MGATTEIKHNPYYYEKDPAKKDYAWAQNLVTLFRGEWRHIIDVNRANNGMAYLLSKQDLDMVKDSFKKGGSFTETLDRNKKWLPIAVMDRIRNILIAEFLKSAYAPHVEAIDVAAQDQKKKDKKLLKGRRMIEKVMTDLQTRVGDPPYKMPAEKFEGNVEQFDSMGLDDRSETDINFFMQTFHRLWHETSAQELVRALMATNEFENNVEDLVNDILAKLAVTFQVYASPSTGETKWKYLKPESVKAIWGERQDGKDAACLGFEKDITVRQFLEFTGPEFDFARDKDALTKAVNFRNNTSYDYITRSGCYSIDGEGMHHQVADYATLLRHSVGVGYIEWKTVDRQLDEKRNKTNGLLYPMTDKDKNIFPEEKFTREVLEFQKTYKTWFLGTGGPTQYLFRFGPLYHMLTHGAHDEYSSYSIHTFIGRGKSAMEIAEPFIDIVQEAFYKMLWAIKESTPRKRVYNYDSIIQIVSKLTPPKTDMMGGDSDTPKPSVANQINAVLESYRTSLIELYTIPEVDGQKLGGNQRMNYTDSDGAGLDPLAPAMQTVMDWAEAQVSMRLGINPLREAYSPDQKDGYKLGMQAIQQSRNATHYIPRMIEAIIKNSATSSMLIAQDAIEYKTPVYDYIVQLIGADAIESFRSLEKIPHHRYGMFVDVFSGEDKRAELKEEAMIAFQRQEIRYEDYLIVKEIDDYKKAGMVLTFFKQRQEKKQEQAAKVAHDRQMELLNQKVNGELTVIDRKGEWMVREETERGKYYMAAHQTPADTKIITKQMDQENNAQKLNEKADAQIKVNKARDESQAVRPLPASTSEQSAQSQSDEQEP